jgi:hypothetical protein
MTYELEGARVRVHAPHIPGEEGEVLRYNPATEQYLVSVNGTGSVLWISTSDVEVIGCRCAL